MQQKISKFIFRLMGWKAVGQAIEKNKCIFVGVPHTSAWDFVVAWLFYKSLGGNANILIKKEFFFWPIGFFVRKMGGIPIDRSKGTSVIRQVIHQFKSRETMQLAITPEGTRKCTTSWKAGFHTIARAANVPVYPVTFDWGTKTMTIWEQFELTDDSRFDLKRLKKFFREKNVQGKYPENYSAEE